MFIFLRSVAFFHILNLPYASTTMPINMLISPSAGRRQAHVSEPAGMAIIFSRLGGSGLHSGDYLPKEARPRGVPKILICYTRMSRCRAIGKMKGAKATCCLRLSD